MRQAIVRNGVVENVIVLPTDADWTAPLGTTVVPCGSDTGPGDGYVNGAFTKPESIVLQVKIPNDREEDCRELLTEGAGDVDLVKLFKAKLLSDLALRLGKKPADLADAEVAAEVNRIAALYKIQ